MKIILNLLSLIILSLFIASCNKDPYPEDGNLRVTQRREQNPPTIAIAMVVPDEVNLSEGRSFKQAVKVSVPSPGQPVVEVENLPAGATFDAETLTINWKPSFKDGNDPQDPTIRVRRYNITVRLFTTEEGRTNESLVREMALFVYDVPQAFEINAANSKTVREGSTLVYNFKIENEDYPQGPFNIYSSDIPANAKIERVKNKTNEFTLTYTPDFHHVKLNDGAVNCGGWDDDCFIYKGKITAINPAGHKVEKDITINVKDKRQDVELSVPDDMVGGLDISFSVSAVDPNGEVAPSITYDGTKPEFGTFTTKLEKDEENNFSVLYVTWTDIPPSYNGQARNFSFDSCVLYDDSTNLDYCESSSFSAQIKVKDRKAPTFSRESWKVGEIKYLPHNSAMTARIGVKDGDSFRAVNRVEVLPKTMQKYISFKNGILDIKGIKKAGYYQFTLSAVSEYNVSSAESFVFEVFDSKRSETLYFTDSTRDAEVAFYRDTMKNVELLNPVLQPLNTRNLAGRETLIIGTGILADPERKADIAKAMTQIKNVVIASPLIENMPKDFLNELQRDFRVSITGRYSDISGAPDLSRMYFVARSDLQGTRGKIKLKLTSTPESLDPLIFSVGVDRKNCQDVLDFTDQGTDSLFKIGVICDRKGGGRYAILGTEFADLKASLFDKKIPAKWLRQMLSTRLNPINPVNSKKDL